MEYLLDYLASLVSSLSYLLPVLLFTLLASAMAICFYPRMRTPAWLVTFASVLVMLQFNMNMVTYFVLDYRRSGDLKQLMAISSIITQNLYFLFLVVMLGAVFADRGRATSPAGRGPILFAHGLLSLVMMPWLSPLVLTVAIWSLRTRRTTDRNDLTLTRVALGLSALMLLLIIAGLAFTVPRILALYLY